MAALDTTPAIPAGLSRPFRVLIGDDQPDVLAAMGLLLKSAGWQAVTVESPKALLEAARGEAFDVILADLNYTRDTTSGLEGLDLLASLEAQGNRAPVMVMTAWGSIELAVEAMRRGACDFIQKPWDNAHVLEAIRKQAGVGRRRVSELEIASSVQRRLFPNRQRKLVSIDYAGHCEPASGVGGDYYDFLDAGPYGLAFILADISGKGIPAALLMANLQACFRSQSAAALAQPAELLTSVNRHFYASTGADRYATTVFGCYDDRRRTLRYVNAGHCAPLLARASGEIEELDATATLLGAFDEWDGVEAEIELQPGDMLLLYSDGVTEAANGAGDEFGAERLRGLMTEHAARPAAELVLEVARAVERFTSGTPTDDVTVVAIRGL